MIQKGGFSFVAMLVINPIVILFYQNCSMAPISYANSTQAPVAALVQQDRSIASEQSKEVSFVGGKVSCPPNQSKECLRAE